MRIATNPSKAQIWIVDKLVIYVCTACSKNTSQDCEQDGTGQYNYICRDCSTKGYRLVPDKYWGEKLYYLPRNVSPKVNKARIYNENRTLKRMEEKALAFSHYGGSTCACCGESNIRFLTIDHVDNDGAKHRKAMKTSDIYRWLQEHNYPQGNFQVLCMNCNWAKGIYGKCPHTATA